MNKKIIITVVLVAVLALGGTLVYAAVNEDGGWVNPFAGVLSSKIEDGTITQQEADIFNKVMEIIKGDFNKDVGMIKRADGRFAKGERLLINKEAVEQIKALMETKTNEIIAGLVEDGILDSSALSENGLKEALKGADEGTIAVVKEAFAELDSYYKSTLESLVADGTLTQDEADVLLKIKGKGADSVRFKMKSGNFEGRMPGLCPCPEQP